MCIIFVKKGTLVSIIGVFKNDSELLELSKGLSSVDKIFFLKNGCHIEKIDHILSYKNSNMCKRIEIT